MIRLAEYRKSTHLTQVQLAERIGVSVDTIIRWERGYREPKTSQLLKLAEILGCTAMDLLGETGDPQFPPQVGEGEAKTA